MTMFFGRRTFIETRRFSDLLLAIALHYGNCFAEELIRPPDKMFETSRGVIFAKNVSVEVGVCKTLPNCWTPSGKHISLMEKELSTFLKNSNVMGAPEIFSNFELYKRKYYGYKRSGTRYIHVNGLCEKYWKPTSLKFASPGRSMTDMGPCYFLIDYNIERNTFSNFYVDGD